MTSNNPQIIELGTVFKGSPSGKVVKAKGGQRVLGTNQLAIDIVASGVCGTELHFLKADMVLGHEGVGRVSAIGSEVKSFKLGDRVGWGYVHDACLDADCAACASGRDTNCPHRVEYGSGDLDFASFGDKAVLNHKFVHKLPDSLDFNSASVLQCGGATVVGAIVNSGITPFQRVGVVGIGGLGHLLLQYLRAMGCEVVCFTSSASKVEEAKSFGASEVVVTKENPKLANVKKVNTLIVTASFQIDWEPYFDIVLANGKIVPLTVSSESMTHPYAIMVDNDMCVQGSFVATRSVHAQMLEFSARHQIKPTIEVLPMTEKGINEAIERLKTGDVRYRFVLESQTYRPQL